MPAREGHSKIVNLAQTTMKIMTTTNTRKGPSLPSLPNDRIGSRVKRFRFALILLHFFKLYCKNSRLNLARWIGFTFYILWNVPISFSIGFVLSYDEEE